MNLLLHFMAIWILLGILFVAVLERASARTGGDAMSGQENIDRER